MKRLFLGIRPTEETLKSLSGYQHQVKTSPPHGFRATFPQLASFHMTLHFLGETPPSRMDQLRRGLFRLWPTLAEEGPFVQTLDEWAFLPAVEKAKVAAIGSTIVVPQLVRWHRELSKLIESLGFQAEKRAFYPHVTLARFSKPIRVTQPPWPGPLPFEITNLVLYESLGGEGPTYASVQEFRLARP